MKPNCYNRPPFKDTVLVQDGWRLDSVMVKETGEIFTTRWPVMEAIPDPMSKGCQQHGPKGEATLHPESWDCDGCKWKPDERNDGTR